MRILVNSQEMKECDTCTIQEFQVPSMVLMERAALSVVEEIERQHIDRSRCLVICGLGNNGGDGLAIARLLYQKGSQVMILCDMQEEKATEQTRAQYEIVCRYGIPVVTTLPKESFTLVIDAVFGIGLSREVQGHWREMIEALNERSGYKLAVDIPSGISADTGQILGCAFRADLTVTFAYGKLGLSLYPGYLYSGTVVVKDIGIDGHSWENRRPSAFSYEPRDIHLLPRRKRYSNKGSYGKVLVIAGKKNMAGAAYFSAKAAAVTGCGLVKILTAEENRTILQQLVPEAILTTFEWGNILEEGDSAGIKSFQDTVRGWESRIREAVSWADVIVAGPGLGTGPEVEFLVKSIFSGAKAGETEDGVPLLMDKNANHERAGKPLILDADALNYLAGQTEVLKEYEGPIIVTPHMGEMSRLTGASIESLKRNLPKAALTFAENHGVTCVLKDARTVTALTDGTFYINESGNNGMATGGAGDVLTGVIAGLIAQGMKPEEAAGFGVFLHGLAGDVMVEETGCYSMMASDLIAGIRKITRKEAGNEYL